MQAKSFPIALCGILTALGTVLLLSGGLIPIATYAAPLFAALLLISVRREAGEKQAWSVFLATAILALLLGADKEAAFFYLFVGYYPLLRPKLNRLKRFALPVKIFYFTAAVCAMYALLLYVLHLEAVAADFAESAMWLNIAFFVLMIFAMLIYDRFLAAFEILYERRIRKKLKFRS